jgi:hypothetical protein
MEEKSLKISLLVDSLLRESGYKYLKIHHPNEDGFIKLKTDANSQTLIGFLDEFFDLGYKVDGISKKEFDSIDETSKVLEFKVKND